jgi:hypothetical protein
MRQLGEPSVGAEDRVRRLALVELTGAFVGDRAFGGGVSDELVIFASVGSLMCICRTGSTPVKILLEVSVKPKAVLT